MAAIFDFVFSTPRSARLLAAAEHMSAAAGEIGFLVSTVLALAFSLVAIAGFLA
jgi:hypothetical protein